MYVNSYIDVFRLTTAFTQSRIRFYASAINNIAVVYVCVDNIGS